MLRHHLHSSMEYKLLKVQVIDLAANFMGLKSGEVRLGNVKASVLCKHVLQMCGTS